MSTRQSDADRARLSGPGMRTFLAIADQWQLTFMETVEALGIPAAQDFDAWCAAARGHAELILPGPTLMRISAIFGIHVALGHLYREEDTRAWLRRRLDCEPFLGRTPIDMLTNADLFAGELDDMLAVARRSGWLRGVNLDGDGRG